MDFNVLKKVAKELNTLNCNWGVGGSLLLYFHGIVSSPKDIDILIEAKDIKKTKKFMDDIGKNLNFPSKEPFRTKEFCGYDIEGTCIELIGDFKIALDDSGVYEFMLDHHAIVKTIELEDAKIPLTSLEDWFVAYMVMKDPKKRVPLIKKHFTQFGIKHPYLLERNLKQDLPKYIKDEIKKVLLNL